MNWNEQYERRVKAQHVAQKQLEITAHLKLLVQQPTSQVCAGCKLELPADAFNKQRGKGGQLRLDKLCRLCRSEMTKQRRKVKRELGK